MKTATHIARTIGNVVLWVFAVFGVLCGGLWVAHQLGWVQPLVVVSGSMSPTFDTGDLLFATPTPATEVEVGDVTTLYNTTTEKLVTHRVIDVAAVGDTVHIQMKGDANKTADQEQYAVGAGTTVWQPVLTVPHGGDVVAAILRPAVIIPAAIGLLALIGLAMLSRPEDEAEESGETADPAPGTDALNDSKTDAAASDPIDDNDDRPSRRARRERALTP